LARRLAKGNEALITASNNEKAYQQFLGQQNNLSLPDVIGQTRGINKLRKQIAEAAKVSDPVLISGEAGTEKLVVAAEIHKTGDRSSHPFMYINAEDVTLIGAGLVSNDSFQLETAQCSALFGHIRGSFPHAESDRLGLLQICREGTVVIENIEFLSPAVQEDLLHCINSGAFTPLGSKETITTSARIIGTSTLSMAKLKEHEAMNDGLVELLESSHLMVPSLRRRKKDLRLLVDFIIIQECFKSPDRKLIKGMSDEAYQRIMGYDWPGNMEELEVVIRRAIILAQGDYLMPEDIFVGMAPPEGKHTINLLTFDQVRNVFINRLFPVGLQMITGVVFALIFLLAFAGSSAPESNIILVMVWAMWWPVLVISWFFGARIWCSICPMGAANDLLSKFVSLKKKVPKSVRSYGVYISAAGLALIVYVEAASHMTMSPLATGFLLLSILSCAVLSGLFFERRLWCRYLCPLGRLAAVFSGFSLVEFRSNSSICNSTCQTNACFKGTDEVAGCPLYQGPFSLRSNQNCILCGNCVKICKEASPTFNLRIPGHELWAAVKTERVIAVFVPVILGTQILRGLEQTTIAHYLETVTRSTWAAYGLILLAGMILSYYFLILAGNLSFGTLKDRTLLKSHLLMNAIIPLAFTFEFGYQLRPLLEHMGDFFPVLGNQIGYSLDFLAFSAGKGAAKPWQVISILFGMLISMLFLKVLIKNHQRAAGKKEDLKSTRYLPIIFIAVLYITMFIFAG
jgi:transcriptional regulator with AAA-type ATPase domain/polyferredoxin